MNHAIWQKIGICKMNPKFIFCCKKFNHESLFLSMEALQSHISISHKHLSLGSAAATASATSNGGGSTSSQMPPLMIQSQSKPQYRCDICQQTFRTESFLSQHKMSFHKISSTPGVVEPGFGCTECGQMFQSQGQLTKHMRLHG